MIVYNENNQQLLSVPNRNLRRVYENNSNISNIFSVLLLGFCVYLMYSIFIFVPIFADLIFGFVNVYYYNTYNCVQHPFIDITSWMLLNGFLGYLGVVMYINLKYIIREEGFCNKMIRVFCYVISLFSLIWISIGMISFFKSYYKVEKCTSLYPLLYNYLLIRMILGPLIWIVNFIIIIKE